MASDSWLVVGLGNPGPDYAAHRHNIGFMVAGELARRMGVVPKRHRRALALTAEGRIRPGGPRLQLVLPLSYMNRSGGPVSQLAASLSIPLERTLVIHDELDLPFGTLRLKQGGGHGGHNGLRDLSAAMGPDYARLRFGIGRPPGRQDAADFVLRPFAKSEQAELELLVALAADAVEEVATDGLLTAQQRLHAPR